MYMYRVFVILMVYCVVCAIAAFTNVLIYSAVKLQVCLINLLLCLLFIESKACEKEMSIPQLSCMKYDTFAVCV